MSEFNCSRPLTAGPAPAIHIGKSRRSRSTGMGSMPPSPKQGAALERQQLKTRASGLGSSLKHRTINPNGGPKSSVGPRDNSQRVDLSLDRSPSPISPPLGHANPPHQKREEASFLRRSVCSIEEPKASQPGHVRDDIATPSWIPQFGNLPASIRLSFRWPPNILAAIGVPPDVRESW